MNDDLLLLFWLTVVVVFIVLTIIAVKKAFRLEAVFFDSYRDFIIPLIPLAVLPIAFLIFGPVGIFFVMLTGLFAITYHGIQAFRLNPRSKGIAACVMAGRLVVGFVAPVYIVLRLMPSGKNQGESDTAHELRIIREHVVTAAIAAGLLTLIRRLVNGEAVRQNLTSYEVPVTPIEEEPAHSFSASSASPTPVGQMDRLPGPAKTGTPVSADDLKQLDMVARGLERDLEELQDALAAEPGQTILEAHPDFFGGEFLKAFLRKELALAKSRVESGTEEEWNPYQVLGVPPNASRLEIREALRVLEPFFIERTGKLPDELRDVANRRESEIKDAYRSLIKQLGEVTDEDSELGVCSLSQEQIEQMLADESTPSPQYHEGTLDAWLKRLFLWGRVIITHIDPANLTIQQLTTEQFLERIKCKTVKTLLEQWDHLAGDQNQACLERYMVIDGVEFKEQFIVRVEMFPEFRKAIFMEE